MAERLTSEKHVHYRQYEDGYEKDTNLQPVTRTPAWLYTFESRVVHVVIVIVIVIIIIIIICFVKWLLVKLRSFSLQAKYTDRATASCRRS
jgi:hypothetical protein